VEADMPRQRRSEAVAESEGTKKQAVTLLAFTARAKYYIL
jgi:hypothetical protein